MADNLIENPEQQPEPVQDAAGAGAGATERAETQPAAPTTPAVPELVETAPTLPGVPHNLGVDRRASLGFAGAGGKRGEQVSGAAGGAANGFAGGAASGSASSAGGSSASSAAPDSLAERTEPAAAPLTTAPHLPREQGAKGKQAAGVQSGLRSGAGASSLDRAFTVALLVFGAIGALTLGQSMLALPAQLHTMLSALAGEHTVPEFVRPVSAGIAFGLLTLYVGALFWSVHRLRTKKLSFWVPLAAGALAIIVVIVTGVFVLLGTIPADALGDAEQMQLMLDALQNATQNSL